MAVKAKRKPKANQTHGRTHETKGYSSLTSGNFRLTPLRAATASIGANKTHDHTHTRLGQRENTCCCVRSEPVFSIRPGGVVYTYTRVHTPLRPLRLYRPHLQKRLHSVGSRLHRQASSHLLLSSRGVCARDRSKHHLNTNVVLISHHMASGKRGDRRTKERGRTGEDSLTSTAQHNATHHNTTQHSTTRKNRYPLSGISYNRIASTTSTSCQARP